MKKLPSDFLSKRNKLRMGAELLFIITDDHHILEVYDTITDPFKPVDSESQGYFIGAFKTACYSDLIHEDFGKYLSLAAEASHLRITEEFLYANKDTDTAEAR